MIWAYVLTTSRQSVLHVQSRRWSLQMLLPEKLTWDWFIQPDFPYPNITVHHESRSGLPLRLCRQPADDSGSKAQLVLTSPMIWLAWTLRWNDCSTLGWPWKEIHTVPSYVVWLCSVLSELKGKIPPGKVGCAHLAWKCMLWHLRWPNHQRRHSRASGGSGAERHSPVRKGSFASFHGPRRYLWCYSPR